MEVEENAEKAARGKVRIGSEARVQLCEQSSFSLAISGSLRLSLLANSRQIPIEECAKGRTPMAMARLFLGI